MNGRKKVTLGTVLGIIAGAGVMFGVSNTILEKHDTRVVSAAVIEKRVESLEKEVREVRKEMHEVRNWVHDLHSVVVRGEAAPIRDNPPHFHGEEGP